jgi:hypothetical protein
VVEVLGRERLAQQLAHARLLAAILAHAAGEHGHAVAGLLAGADEPALDGGGAEAHRLSGRGMAPHPPREILERAAELSAGRGRRQQRPYDREAQLGPAAG